MPSSSRPNRVQLGVRVFAEQRWSHYLLLTLAMTALAYYCHVQHWRWADALDNLVVDTGFRLRQPDTPIDVAESLPATRDIVLIELPHPVPRRLLAELPLLLRDADAVAFDLMLVDQKRELNGVEKPWYTNEMQEWDRDTAVLASALKRSGNTVIGAWIDETWTENPKRRGAFTRERAWQMPASDFWESARYHAHLLVYPDAADHIVRRVPLFQDIRVAGKDGQPARTMRVPCLALALAAAGKHISPAQLDAQLAQLPVHGSQLRLGNLVIPYDEDGMLDIDYVGPRECFEYGTNRVVYDRVLRLYQPADFAGKLVIIGSSDVKSNDMFPTPYGVMAGMQVHANVVATLLSNHRPVFQVTPWMLICLACLCSLLPVLPLLRWPLWSSFLVALTEIFLVITLAAWLFAHAHTRISASIFVLAIVFTYNAIVLYEYSRVRITLAKFVGPDMLKRTLYQMAHLRLGVGSVEEACAMFCDLRGYTALSESLPPDAITNIINEYTDAVVHIARRHHGRPVDFAGDGIFILFEQSLAGRHFVRNAVDAALELHREFAQLQQQRNSQYLPLLEVGVALHTGRMMIGLLGSEHFLKMGAIGDVVNVAARVQALSRDCGYDVLLTRETFQRLDPDFSVDYCGAFPLRGREHPVEVYGLTATRHAAQPQQSSVSEVSDVLQRDNAE